jgi:hypothetical protein
MIYVHYDPHLHMDIRGIIDWLSLLNHDYFLHPPSAKNDEYFPRGLYCFVRNETAVPPGAIEHTTASMCRRWAPGSRPKKREQQARNASDDDRVDRN